NKSNGASFRRPRSAWPVARVGGLDVSVGSRTVVWLCDSFILHSEVSRFGLRSAPNPDGLTIGNAPRGLQARAEIAYTNPKRKRRKRASSSLADAAVPLESNGRTASANYGLGNRLNEQRANCQVNRRPGPMGGN